MQSNANNFYLTLFHLWVTVCTFLDRILNMGKPLNSLMLHCTDKWKSTKAKHILTEDGVGSCYKVQYNIYAFVCLLACLLACFCWDISAHKTLHPRQACIT